MSDEADLQALAARIREWQTEAELSDNALLRKLPQLGSTKTFSRVLKGDLAELDVEKQLVNYTSAWSFVETLKDDAAEAGDEIYDDLTPAVELRRAWLRTRKETGLARVIFLLGPSGAGKTGARRALVSKFGARFVVVEASVSWNDKPGALFGAILTQLGCRSISQFAIEREERVVEMLNETRRCIIIEEAQHLGPRLLNVLKTLVNQTPGEFVLCAVDSLWRKLESHGSAYEEAKQLTGNRMAERITLARELNPRDVEKMVSRGVNCPLEKAAIRLLTDRAANYGKLAFVRAVIRRTREKADGQPTPELFAAAIQEETASR